MGRRQDRERIRSADIILITACLLSAAVLGVFMLLQRRGGAVASISCDGVRVAVIELGSTAASGVSGRQEMTEQPEAAQETRYYLLSHEDGTFTMTACGSDPSLPEDGGFNLLSVSDGAVRMEAADCRDQICVRHRAVSAEGESIICLPHKLVIEIEAEEGRGLEGLDGVVE